MRYIDEYRDPALARRMLQRVTRMSTRPVQFMEFCGGHTHAILKYGLRRLLPETIRLRSGPGCPVCVTAAADLDRAIALAGVPNVILTTFGDMVRVPGSRSTLQDARAHGADVRIVYSPLDALAIAQNNPDRPVVFLGVGFETTAPGIAATVLQADAQGIENYYLHSLHKLTLPAMRAILQSDDVRLDGVIGPGHVSAITGSEMWRPLPTEYAMPCAVAGFEPLDILRAVSYLVEMAEGNAPDVRNAYGRGVSAEGNRVAMQTMFRVFAPAKAEWRGLGRLPASGLALRENYAHFDALRAFPVEIEPAIEPRGCRCGDVVRGVVEPTECPLFRTACTPSNPLGPCMVSAEGACAAYYRYGADV